MIKALACCTPVIAYRRGSVPEVLEDGETGFIVTGLEDAVRAATTSTTSWPPRRARTSARVS
jgi:glycosyltransferase involved in cell wall biosynthesis